MIEPVTTSVGAVDGNTMWMVFGNVTPGVADDTVADAIGIVVVPTFWIVTKRRPVSPLSRTPSPSHDAAASSSVAPVTARPGPVTKLSVTVELVVENRSGEIAPTPAPRLANAC